MLVYRDGSRRVAGRSLRHDLLERVARLESQPAGLPALLLLAGELESSLGDAGAPSHAAARLTDVFAEACVFRTRLDPRALSQHLQALRLPDELRLVRPEGYAYYALDPGSYARLVADRAWPAGERVAVLGIRSIGTSLSAIVRAGLRARGLLAERITVRPQGHPWDRRFELSASHQQFVHGWQDARYLVVDEGPGLSGSTFLAVGEALTRVGVPSERIEFLTSRAVDPERLLAPDAAQRWRRFRATSVPEAAPPVAGRDLGAGAWRELVYATEQDWPASFTNLERRKYKCETSGALIKFVGFAPYGEAPLQRGECLAGAGFCPAVRAHDPGYVAHTWLEGRVLDPSRERARALRRLLEYLVFRSQAFRAQEASVEQLDAMLQLNLSEALGMQLPASVRLQVERPVYADGRLLPHEWIVTSDGQIMKVDATDHGDDHLLPGPCDSAWDLAGAVVEWQLTSAERSQLFAAYKERTGDDVRARVTAYVLAYTAFRVGHCHMAALSSGPAEQVRLRRAGQGYVELLRQLAMSPSLLDA
jgi:hypothetical protein